MAVSCRKRKKTICSLDASFGKAPGEQGDYKDGDENEDHL
jgi:hypothetical protein